MITAKQLSYVNLWPREYFLPMVGKRTWPIVPQILRIYGTITAKQLSYVNLCACENFLAALGKRTCAIIPKILRIYGIITAKQLWYTCIFAPLNFFFNPWKRRCVNSILAAAFAAKELSNNKMEKVNWVEHISDRSKRLCGAEFGLWTEESGISGHSGIWPWYPPWIAWTIHQTMRFCISPGRCELP